MTVFDGETKFNRQEIVANKSHQQDEVIDDGLNIVRLDCIQGLLELLPEVFAQNVEKNILEFRFLVATHVGCRSLNQIEVTYPKLFFKESSLMMQMFSMLREMVKRITSASAEYTQ